MGNSMLIDSDEPLHSRNWQVIDKELSEQLQNIESDENAAGFDWLWKNLFATSAAVFRMRRCFRPMFLFRCLHV